MNFFYIFFRFFPFSIAVIAPDGVWIQEDLTLYKPPTSEVRKITWYNNGKSDLLAGRENSLPKDPNSQSPTSLRSDVRRRAARFLNRPSMTSAVSGVTTTEDPSLVAEIFFHRSVSDVLVAVYPRQIVLVSLRYLCPYRVISLEKASTDLFSVLPLRQLDGFLCLHQNGAVSFRHARDRKHYEAVLQPESSRLMKQCKPYGFVVDPVDETKCSILLNDGRLMVWSLHSGGGGGGGGGSGALPVPSNNGRVLRKTIPQLNLCRLNL